MSVTDALKLTLTSLVMKADYPFVGCDKAGIRHLPLGLR